MSSWMMSRVRFSSTAVLLGVLATGCAKPPVAEIDAADNAMEVAMVSGAEEYAPEALGQVNDVRSQLETELSLQGEKWALTRSYDRALELAGQVKTLSETAAAEAGTAKEAARQETQVLLAEVKVALEETQAMLAAAPTGKGSAADLAMLKADLDSAALTLGEGEAAFAQGRFLEAKSKVMSVKSGTETVRSAIEAAVQARSPRRGSSS